MIDDTAPKQPTLIQPAIDIEAMAVGKTAIFNLKSFNKDLAPLLADQAITDNDYLSGIKFGVDEDGGLSLGTSTLYVYLGTDPDDLPVTLPTDSCEEAQEVVKALKLALESLTSSPA